VFLDRDGVLNEIVFRNGAVGSPRLLSELEVVPHAADSLRELKAAGYLLICTTNQPEIRTKELLPENLEAINAELRRQLPLDDLLMCLHTDADGCDCRKPKPGMLLQAAERYDIDLPASFMVGDRWRDVDAGANAGCTTVFVDGGYDDRTPEHAPDVKVRSLREAASWILARGGMLD
jgi:D-glycero-D-manno-heptose 1,7-bisphosphate phosphatase